MQQFTLHTATDKIKVITASGWGELTLEQIIALETDYKNDPSVLKAFSILTGLSLEITENLNDPDIEQKVWSIISFVAKPPKWDKLERPKRLMIGGKAYKVPTKIGGLMLGQKIMMLQSADDVETILKNIPLCVATIMQPYVDKLKNKGVLKYSSERVDQVAKQLLKENGLDCYAVAVFFFAKLKNILSFKTKNLQAYQKEKGQTKRLSHKWLKANV